MTQVKWSKKEKDYLMSLALSDGMSVEEVVTMLNDRFDNKRTKTAISIQKHQLLKEKGLTRTNKPRQAVGYTKVKESIDFMEKEVIKMKEVKQTRIQGTQRNARKGWTTADEQYLVAEWTADINQQEKVAEYLGRGTKACQTHLGRLRKHQPELHMALINRGATINVLPAKVENYSILDKIYVMLKFRKQIKAERKLMKAEKKAAKRQAKLEAKIIKLRRLL